MTEEGVIKFKILWKKTPPLEKTGPLQLAREELYQHGLIGAGDNGIGFGNISQRLGSGFLITGSQTGGLKRLTPEHIALVTSYDFAKNRLACSGPIQASSESLSHAAIYDSDPKIQAVAHVHSRALWFGAINQLPTTGENVGYGTPQMASEIIRLYRESNLPQRKVLVMGGHPDGILAFGGSLDQCISALFEVRDRYRV